MGQLSRKETKSTGIQKEDEIFTEFKKMVKEIWCPAHFPRSRNIVETTDASWFGLGKTSWQDWNDYRNRPKAFARRYVIDAEKNYSSGDLETLAVVWGLEKFLFLSCTVEEHINTDHQTLEHLTKQNRAYWQYSARIMGWLDRQADFDIWIKYREVNNLNPTDSLSRNSIKIASIVENCEEE